MPALLNFCIEIAKKLGESTRLLAHPGVLSIDFLCFSSAIARLPAVGRECINRHPRQCQPQLHQVTVVTALGYCKVFILLGAALHRGLYADHGRVFFQRLLLPEIYRDLCLRYFFALTLLARCLTTLRIVFLLFLECVFAQHAELNKFGSSSLTRILISTAKLLATI